MLLSAVLDRLSLPPWICLRALPQLVR